MVPNLTWLNQAMTPGLKRIACYLAPLFLRLSRLLSSAYAPSSAYVPVLFPYVHIAKNQQPHSTLTLYASVLSIFSAVLSFQLFQHSFIHSLLQKMPAKCSIETETAHSPSPTNPVVPPRKKSQKSQKNPHIHARLATAHAEVHATLEALFCDLSGSPPTPSY